MMNGSCLIDLVYVTLKTDENILNMMGQFCEDNVDADVIDGVVTYITRVYCRIRGKDFAHKVMSTNTHSLKQSRRPTLMAASNPKYIKQKSK